MIALYCYVIFVEQGIVHEVRVAVLGVEGCDLFHLLVLAKLTDLLGYKHEVHASIQESPFPVLFVFFCL